VVQNQPQSAQRAQREKKQMGIAIFLSSPKNEYLKKYLNTFAQHTSLQYWQYLIDEKHSPLVVYKNDFKTDRILLRKK